MQTLQFKIKLLQLLDRKEEYSDFAVSVRSCARRKSEQLEQQLVHMYKIHSDHLYELDWFLDKGLVLRLGKKTLKVSLDDEEDLAYFRNCFSPINPDLDLYLNNEANGIRGTRTGMSNATYKKMQKAVKHVNPDMIDSMMSNMTQSKLDSLLSQV